jgi:hypothetical protein
VGKKSAVVRGYLGELVLQHKRDIIEKVRFDLVDVPVPAAIIPLKILMELLRHMAPKSHASGFFDLSSPELFFDAIERAAAELADSDFKSTERLMFVVMGLNHLREWIAPGYDYRQPPTSDAEKFFHHIYSIPEYGVIKSLCNCSKHLSMTSGSLTMPPPLSMDEWPEVDAVSNFDHGPMPAYYVDGRDVMDIIDEVMRVYEEDWFARA